MGWIIETPSGPCPQTTVRSGSLELNSPGGFELVTPIASSDLALLTDGAQVIVGYDTPVNETTVTPGGTVFVGIITKQRNDKDMTVATSCKGLLYIFGRRYFGKANRTNYLVNGNLDTPLGGIPDGWIAAGVTSTVQNDLYLNGAGAVMLSQSGTVQDDLDEVANPDTGDPVPPEHFHAQDTSLQQNVGAAAGAWTLKAWFLIFDAGTLLGSPPVPWICKGFDGRGLYIEEVDGADPTIIYQNSFVGINESTPRWEWTRAELEFHKLYDASKSYLNVRLYSVGGTIVWAAAGLYAMESLSFPTGTTDQGAIVAAVVDHAQDPLFSKSNVGVFSNAVVTGTKRTKTWQFADHENILSAIDDMAKMQKGFDYEIVRNGRPVGQADFLIYSPRKGSLKHEFDLTLGVNLLAIVKDTDLDRASTSVIILGEGDGPDREEGAFVDASQFGGLILEDVVNAPADTPISMLQAKGVLWLQKRKRPQWSLTITTHDRVYAGAGYVTVDNLGAFLDVGDSFVLTAQHGPFIDFDGSTRSIVRVVRKDYESDGVVTLTCVPYNEGDEYTVGE